MKLYEIKAELENGCFDPETGEINDQLMAELQMERDEKIENCLLFIKNMKAEASAIREEEKNLADRRRTLENKAESLGNYIQRILDGEKFKTARAAVSYRASDAVVVDDLKAIPEFYLRYKEPEADKTEIKAALKHGREIPGCHLESKVSMSIK